MIERARAPVGRARAIGAERDRHRHLTKKCVCLSDIIVLYKEFPHTDVVERAEDLLTLVPRAIRGEIHPVMSLYDCRQIASDPTTPPMMRACVDQIAALEGKDGLRRVSIVLWLPYAGVPELAGLILVITDGEKAKADRLATATGEVSMRGKTVPKSMPFDDGISAPSDPGLILGRSRRR